MSFFSKARRTARRPTLTFALWCTLAGASVNANETSPPELKMTSFPVFRRELMQSRLDEAYGDIGRRWGAPVRQIVMNSYCDSWRALHAKTYAVQSVPGHWLTQATKLGYTVLVGVTTDDTYTLLLTRAKTDEQLKSLLNQQGVAVPDRMSGVTSIGRQYLSTQFKLGDGSLKLVEMMYEDMPVLALLQGRYQAALTSPTVYERMQSTLKQDIRVISIPSPSLRAALVVDPAQLAEADVIRLRTLLLDINVSSAPHKVHYVTPDVAAKSDGDQPAIDASHCAIQP